LLVASLPLILHYQPAFTPYILHYQGLLIYSILMSYLLVSELPLMAFKFKSWDWASNQSRYLFLIYCIAMLVMLKFAAFPVLVISYIALSGILSLLNTKQK
jgi:CDP-diacylglycerol--serine O-phosphatidyltransferase